VHLNNVSEPEFQVAAITEPKDDLSAAVRTARRVCPYLFPASLPRHVVIKPNLCDITSWETGVTTDPRWMAALTVELRSIRPDVQIRVVESDAISAYKTYRSCDETFERLGFVSAAREAGIELVNLSRCDTIELRLDGVPMPVRIPELFLAEMLFISVANLKVHPYTRMTGILKNSLGLLSDADISSFHPHLSALISGLHLLCPPDLCIIDGRIGLEGQGPIIGYPVQMNTILFGNDALATDEAACHLMGIPPQQVPHLHQTAKDLKRSFGQFKTIGEIHPKPFAFDSLETHRAILTKFRIRRFYQRMDLFTSRWVDRAHRLRHNPISFATSAVSKLVGGRRGQ
jgi:uncharacterized protein (DUF362 family)